MITIAIMNQKGGVGKTTTAAELAANLVKKGKRVLLIDADPQGNLTFAAGVNPDDSDHKTLKDVFDKKCSIKEAVYYTHSHGALIPNNILMASADRTYVGIGAMKILRTALKKTRDWEFCIIDAPPTLGMLTWNVLIASDYLIIPVNAAAFSIKGLAALHDTIRDVKASENRSLKVLGILLTRYNSRTKLGKSAREDLQKIAQTMKTTVFTSTIRQSVQIEVAQLQQTCLSVSAPTSKVCADYAAFADEVEERLQ